VRSLTIEAVSLASARGFQRALLGFPVEFQLDGHTYTVRVMLRNDSDVINVLRAIEAHMLERDTSTSV
jgi:hypothetical protein